MRADNGQRVFRGGVGRTDLWGGDGDQLEASIQRELYPLDPGRKIFPVDGNIREELILTYPQKILCKLDCKGLCIRCGADLNENKCKCNVS